MSDQVNDSLVRDLFPANIRQDIPSGLIRAKYDEALNGAGDKLQVKYDDGMIIHLWVNLNGSIGVTQRLH